MPLLKPPNFEKVRDHKLMFLIGPIQGAEDWQNPTAQWFLDRVPELYVASPRSEMWPPGLSQEEHDRRFAIQADWEHDYIEEIIMRIARGSTTDYIFAWCSKEVHHNPKRAYAQTTRFELGTILGWIDASKNRRPFSGEGMSRAPHEPVFIGADPAFSGRQYLEHTLKKKGRPLLSSLEQTREHALNYIRNYS